MTRRLIRGFKLKETDTPILRGVSIIQKINQHFKKLTETSCYIVCVPRTPPNRTNLEIENTHDK